MPGLVSAWLKVRVLPTIPVTVVPGEMPVPLTAWPTTTPAALATTTAFAPLVAPSVKVSGVALPTVAAWLRVTVVPAIAVTVVPPGMPAPVMV